jgi:predicted ferric reductase
MDRAQNIQYEPSLKLFLKILFALVSLLLLLGALSIPLLFESFTIQYKFGLERILLRAGKMVGLAAGLIVFFQLVLAARIKTLDRVFSINHLLHYHQTMGIAITTLALLHAILILVSQGSETLRPDIKQWPEYMGVLLLLTIMGIVLFSLKRQSFGIPFPVWWLFHRIGTPATVVALAIHVLFVSDTFEKGLPQALVFLALALYALLYFWTKSRKHFLRRHPYIVKDVTPVAKDAICVRLEAENRRDFLYVPGHFAFLSFESNHVTREEHPFTISSSPTRPSDLQFTIRVSGDWTRSLHRLRPGDQAYVDGPFGLFGHGILKESKETIMLAGGIGVTPMLSMLRYRADIQDDGAVILVWSNQTKDYITYPEEIAELEIKLKWLRVIHVLTRDPQYEGETGRLDRLKLERLLTHCSRKSNIYLCGPPLMMEEVRHTLLSMGFSRRSIRMERFSL